MSKTIFERVESLGERVKAQGGECVMIVRDGGSDDTQCIIHAYDGKSAMSMFIDFMRANPKLISVVLHAAALAMECDGDCDNCQLCDYDDDEDEEDEDCEDSLCMN